MKQLLFLFTFCLLTSCNKRIVLLPETTNKDITEVTDVSPVYMFYDEEKDSVEFNRRNMITSTNWLVNIDKRLTLQQILPHLKYLQEKRNGDSIHRNYFTCNNTDLKNLSFIEFTDVVYHDESYFDYMSIRSNIPMSNTLVINFLSMDKILIPGILDNSTLKLSTNESFVKDIIENHKIEGTKIILDFNENFTVQEYISIKTRLLELKETNIIITNDEFIHN